MHAHTRARRDRETQTDRAIEGQKERGRESSDALLHALRRSWNRRVVADFASTHQHLKREENERGREGGRVAGRGGGGGGGGGVEGVGERER